ncbi:hypothetical protein CMI47_14145 [Candidatus Pacearchaeota archaeon]|jgi:hypothetical protein|nr:hypothetical protein [Candidatus Pacearchaeota archaeon]|tara:strand:+ start:3276 stop:3953 length:678 start_codon:yes stop_codon:yes gene_type:complete
MVEFLGAEIPLPTFGVGTGAIVLAFSIFLIILAGAVIIYFVYMMRIYNRKIVVFENISGQGFQPVYKDTARLVSLGDGGEELLFLRKKKVYRTAYGRKMGKNTYWFVIGQDGYWYNSLLGDLDAKMGMLDIEPVDRDMRYMHVAVRKNIQERYRKINIMEKYGAIAMSGLFLIIMLMGIWFLLDKIALISTGMSNAIDAVTKVQDETRVVLSALDNVCSGGTGLK